MLKKQSKQRKNKTNQKLINSRSKLPKQPIKQKLQIKERKISNKHNHQSSTFTLLSNHNNSQCSMGECDEDNLKKGKSKNMRQSVSSLLGKDGANKDKQREKQKGKKDVVKIKKNSSVNVNSKSKKNISKVSPAKIDKNSKILKQNPKKSKLLNQQQLYQRINLALYKTKTNSQINFSNNSSVRENNVSNISNSNLYNNYLGKNRNEAKYTNKKTLTIDCSDQYILNQYFSNSRIKNSDKKKQDAAIKIQKVFRGFLTRKMLQQFIEKQEEKLHEIEKKIKNTSSRQSQDFAAGLLKKQLNKQQKYDDDSFEYEVPNKFFHQKPQLSKQQQIPIKITPQIPQKQDSTKQLKNPSTPLYIDLQLKQSKKQIYPAVNHSALEEQSSIYPQQHDSISRYLPFNQNTNDINGLDDQSEIYENYENVRLNQNYGRCERQEEEEDGRQFEKSGQYVEKQEFKCKEISEELFKYTPSSRAQKSKSKIEQPMPTDFSEKRVHEFESDLNEGKSKQLSEIGRQNDPFTKPPKKPINQNQSNPNIIRNNKKTQHDRKQIVLLKKQEKQKWSKIIDMLSHQIVETKSKNQDNQKFMRMILDFSKKNKEQLQKSSSNLIQPSLQDINYSAKRQSKQDNLTFLKEQISLDLSPSKIMSKQFEFSQLNPKNQQEPKYETKSQKNENMPFMNKKPTNLNINLYNCHVPKSHNKQNYSLFEKTEQLKNFYKKNFAAYPIEQMVQIRQKALEKRQKQMMNKLNEEMSSMALTHEQFIQRLSQMQQKFENERNMINQAKMQIFIGYRATHQLMQDSVKDAWYLGFKIPFSQSLKDFKGTNHNNLWVRDVIVDQLKSFGHHSNQKSSPRDKKQPQIIKQHNRITNLQQSIESSPYKQKSSQKKRQDLSISLPHQDSSLTIRPSNEVSQQSFSQQISYNQGLVQIHGLEEHAEKDEFIFNDDLSEEEQSSEQKQQERQVKGFRKVDPQKLVKKKLIQNQNFHEGTLLLDPDQQQEIDQKVMRKISVNQRRRPHQSYINLEKIRNYQMTPRHSSNLAKIPALQPKSEIYKVDSGSDDSEEDEIIFNEEMDPQIKQITEQQVVKLIWEAVAQFFISNTMKGKLSKNKSKRPTIIDVSQRKSFIRYLQKQIPHFSVLKPRINQKMMASRLELLKFMRITFDDDSEELDENFYGGSNSDRFSSDDGFEEIGKFQHILPSDVCISALNKYLNLQQQSITKQITQDQQRLIQKKIYQNFESKLPKQCIKKIIQRQKLSVNNKFQKQDLRKQIKKVQFHCIFDSLNQILMKRRLRSIGYSGIGLNQLTMVISRQSFKQISSQSQYKQIEKQSFKELNQLISNDKSSNDKLLMENYQKLCENDSQWIYYTDQALSFALEFVYMLEDEIFFQETSLVCKFLRRL